MSSSASLLGQVRPSVADTAASLYVVPSAKETIFRNLLIVNTTNAAAKATVYHDILGATFDESTSIGWKMDVPPGKPLSLADFFADDVVGGEIQVESNVGNALTFTLYGAEKDPT